MMHREFQCADGILGKPFIKNTTIFLEKNVTTFEHHFPMHNPAKGASQGCYVLNKNKGQKNLTQEIQKSGTSLLAFQNIWAQKN